MWCPKALTQPAVRTKHEGRVASKTVHTFNGTWDITLPHANVRYLMYGRFRLSAEKMAQLARWLERLTSLTQPMDACACSKTPASPAAGLVGNRAALMAARWGIAATQQRSLQSGTIQR